VGKPYTAGTMEGTDVLATAHCWFQDYANNEDNAATTIQNL
jgi:hypothetical protein